MFLMLCFNICGFLKYCFWVLDVKYFIKVKKKKEGLALILLWVYL